MVTVPNQSSIKQAMRSL